MHVVELLFSQTRKKQTFPWTEKKSWRFNWRSKHWNLNSFYQVRECSICCVCTESIRQYQHTQLDNVQFCFWAWHDKEGNCFGQAATYFHCKTVHCADTGPAEVESVTAPNIFNLTNSGGRSSQIIYLSKVAIPQYRNTCTRKGPACKMLLKY